jgi:putative endonuclease
MRGHNYYLYILTNKYRTVYYTGVTNNLFRRIYEHKFQKPDSFCRRYKCYDLIYYEWFRNINNCIEREKQIKRWSRKKKIKLIKIMNPTLKCLNDLLTYQ